MSAQVFARYRYLPPTPINREWCKEFHPIPVQQIITRGVSPWCTSHRYTRIIAAGKHSWKWMLFQNHQQRWSRSSKRRVSILMVLRLLKLSDRKLIFPDKNIILSYIIFSNFCCTKASILNIGYSSIIFYISCIVIYVGSLFRVPLFKKKPKETSNYPKIQLTHLDPHPARQIG